MQENADGSQTGGGADLYLELKEGSGRVFLDTFPATKIDTQISTRFAKEIACHFYKLSCDTYDFIYTIKAESNIIGEYFSRSDHSCPYCHRYPLIWIIVKI